MDKLVSSPALAVAGIPDGASLAVGGFGLCGVPMELIGALLRQGTTGLRVVSNNCGVDDHGLGVLLGAGRIARMTASYVGENKEFARRYLAGELEVELAPQGTLAERLRAGGCGIPAFYTPAGVGTQVADGGLPWRYAPDGAVAVASPAREIREFGGRAYVLEEAITTDFGLVHAARGDRYGNLSFHATARNLNPLAAMAGRVTIAQVERLHDRLPPDEVHLPGIFVDRVVVVGDTPKPIERRTTRPAGHRAGAATCGATAPGEAS
ncbi:CoA transferase subunit A [Actinoallomurus purpureus]|uniref:CoA transferase subunit A n=1 Tax=Actinoallomurus purpureus TaxID=478114 RepID=UPI002093FE99|nr:CoA transferase subunit A [Actinoallomurus purpureus]MCO6003938.1 CoA transferase subunit A [Actinoallomurus purpureus]